MWFIGDTGANGSVFERIQRKSGIAICDIDQQIERIRSSTSVLPPSPRSSSISARLTQRFDILVSQRPEHE